jgi:hypothetical protein
MDPQKLIEALEAVGDRAWDLERWEHPTEEKWQYTACVYVTEEESGIGEGCSCIADTPEEALMESLRKLLNGENCIE